MRAGLPVHLEHMHVPQGGLHTLYNTSGCMHEQLWYGVPTRMHTPENLIGTPHELHDRVQLAAQIAQWAPKAPRAWRAN